MICKVSKIAKCVLDSNMITVNVAEQFVYSLGNNSSRYQPVSLVLIKVNDNFGPREKKVWYLMFTAIENLTTWHFKVLHCDSTSSYWWWWWLIMLQGHHCHSPRFYNVIALQLRSERLEKYTHGRSCHLWFALWKGLFQPNPCFPTHTQFLCCLNLSEEDNKST